MKLRIFIIAAILAWHTHSQSFAPEDLQGGTALATGECGPPDSEDRFLCALIEKDKAFYLVIFDGGGLALIYQVNGRKENYTPKDMNLIWERPQSDRRRDV